MSIVKYLTELDTQRNQLARNLVTMGVAADTSEKLNTLVPKVLQIASGSAAVTLFQYGSNALRQYGDSMYTFYVDGFRSIAGLTKSYPHFCCAENNYAIYYNQQDFNWGANIYTLCVQQFRFSASKGILLSYMSGFFETGEMWLVKSDHVQRSYAETAQYIYNEISAGRVIAVPFNWLQTSDSYSSVILRPNSITDGEYYLAWKSVTDNTHPMIRSVKILEVGI